MLRFFFDLHGDDFVPDEEGIELADLNAARSFALANIRGMICEDVASGGFNLQHRIEISDEGGQRLAVVPFGDAVTIDG